MLKCPKYTLSSVIMLEIKSESSQVEMTRSWHWPMFKYSITKKLRKKKNQNSYFDVHHIKV